MYEKEQGLPENYAQVKAGNQDRRLKSLELAVQTYQIGATQTINPEDVLTLARKYATFVFGGSGDR